ncbi:DUF3391 domain-containing protein [Sphingomonas psychrotolerans]|nr:DUF3391 domain-containing protein [Sphingomonas psychrotolerans]
MYIHGFDGSWFSHPFWRTRFLLERPEDLAAVLASEVSAVVIDVERGLAPSVPAPGSAPAHHFVPHLRRPCRSYPATPPKPIASVRRRRLRRRSGS